MRSAAMRKVDALLQAVAAREVAVTLLGESGTGKEVLARRIHERSERRRGPFVPINCAAIPEALFESELFGHERGAFTGATERARGKVEAAAGGTLFLDEIGEMPVAMQAKLLRFLEHRRFMRVGGTTKRDRIAARGGELVDLGGNLSEWARDRWNQQDEPCWGTGIFRDPFCDTESPSLPGARSMRGGYFSGPAGLMKRARRGRIVNEKRAVAAEVGFRCMRPGK